MEILKGFENRELIAALQHRLAELARSKSSYSFMEVCGTHTNAIGRWGLRSLLPSNVRLVSGPGCPVCVTPGEYIDNVCRLALEQRVIVGTFGDLIRVPGQQTSLEEARGKGADIRVLYSPFDAISLAESVPGDVIFLAVGFETTIAGIAATIKAAHQKNLRNLSFYTSLRLVPPALSALIADPELRLDGFLLPGHVSVVIGEAPYDILLKHGQSGVIAGFEPLDILQGIAGLMELVNSGVPQVKNFYTRAVRREGNPLALALFGELFDVTDSVWRGLGTLPASGYSLKSAYRQFDTEKRYGLGALSPQMKSGCACGQVLKGLIAPPQCPLYGSVCTPLSPFGPCMVSSEGTCSTYFKYQE